MVNLCHPAARDPASITRPGPIAFLRYSDLYCFYKNILDFQEEAPVFTLRLQEDGLLTLTFNMIPEAPVFRFERVKTEA